MFTAEDYQTAIILNTEIEEIEGQLATIALLEAAWGEDYPDDNVESSMSFNYQRKYGGVLQIVELTPNTDLVTSMLSCLTTMQTTLTSLKATKEAAFAALGSE